jgi:hypothetical protein
VVLKIGGFSMGTNAGCFTAAGVDPVVKLPIGMPQDGVKGEAIPFLSSFFYPLGD